MARQIKANQSTAAKRRVYFQLVDVTDGMTAETGESGGQPQVSSDGAAWTNTGIGTLNHIGNGRYYADLTQTLVQTAGVIIETRYKSANTAEAVGDQVHVVAYDPDDSAGLGLSTLDSAISSRAADIDLVNLGNFIYGGDLSEDVADKVWDEATSGHQTAGTTGKALTDGGAAPPTAAAIADAVWDEALSGHLSAGSAGAALDSVAVPSGARQITVTIEDGDNAPVADVNVAVYDSSNTSLVTRADTDADGEAVFALDDGTYKVRLSKGGYSFTVPETLTVSADASETFTATEWTPAPASSPTMCMVFGTLLDASGAALEGATVRIHASVPDDIGGNQLVRRVVTTTTDADGYFEIELVRQAEVTLHIPEAGITEQKTVPNLASQNLASW